MQKIILTLLHGYRYVVRPMMGRHCRFYPSCSAYAVTAVECYGALRGLRLAGARVLRCHPWHPGGFDPVPGDGETP